MPNAPGKSGGKGANQHKNPLCPCRICTARRRKAEALIGAGGDGQIDESPEPLRGVNANLPNIHIKGNSIRDRIKQWLEIRAAEPGIKQFDIAKKMGISASTLSGYVYRATKAGWLIFDDPLERIEHEIIPKVVDNLNFFLDAKDKTVTIETAKGTIFKQYQDSKGISDAPQTILALKIETIGVDDQKIIEGHVVGVARELGE